MDWEDMDGNGGALNSSRFGIGRIRAANTLLTNQPCARISTPHTPETERPAKAIPPRSSVATRPLESETGWPRISGCKPMAAEELTTNLGNCPHCTNIIFKDAVFNSEATFSMRCPHCNKNLKVIIRQRVEIVILPVHVEAKPRPKGRGNADMIVVILVLYLPPLIHHLMHYADNIMDIFT